MSRPVPFCSRRKGRATIASVGASWLAVTFFQTLTQKPMLRRMGSVPKFHWLRLLESKNSAAGLSDLIWSALCVHTRPKMNIGTVARSARPAMPASLRQERSGSRKAR